MSYSQTIAMASDLLAEGRAEDVVQMVEPLLVPIEASEAEATARETPSQVRLHAVMARVCIVHRGTADRALDLLGPFDRVEVRRALPDAVRAEVALWLGWAHARRNLQPDEEARALRLLDEAQRLFEQCHVPTGRCWALIGQAQGYFAIDEYHLMRRALEEARTLHAKMRDAQADRWIHDLSIPALRFNGRYADAQEHVDALLALGKRWDDRRVRGHAYAHQAALHHDLGRPPERVLETAGQAIALLRRLDGGADYPLLAAYHATIGALLRQGAWDRAACTIDEAQSAVAGYPVGQAHLQTLRARLAIRRGEWDAAGALLEDLYEQSNQLPHGLQRSHVALLRGERLAQHDKHDDATAWMQRASRNARETGHRGNQLRTLLTLAQAAVDRGDLTAARRTLDGTDAYEDYFGVLPYALRRFRVLGDLAAAESRNADARTAYTQALAAARLIGDTYSTARLQGRLARVVPNAATARALRQTAAATLDKLGAPHDLIVPEADRAPDGVGEPVMPYIADSHSPEADSPQVDSSDADLSTALTHAALSPRLVADAWLRTVGARTPIQWSGVFRVSADGEVECLHERGSRPEGIHPPSTLPDGSLTTGSVHWASLPTPGRSAFVWGVVPDPSGEGPAAWEEDAERLRPWLPVVGLALDRALLHRAPRSPSAPDDDAIPVDGFVSESPAMQALARNIQRVRTSHSPVLITGERGTELDRVARAVHKTSERASGPFETVRCASMQRDPIEAHLLGRVDDAGTLVPGAVHAADGGTLLLEDVEQLPSAVQGALVRLLDAGEVLPVGATRATPVDVRIVATSTADLDTVAGEDRLRDDLYYPLSVLPLRVPPLRQRREDVPLLVRHFLDALRPASAPLVSITSRAMDALLQYDWPGNVRQLRNEIERALVFVGSEPAPTVDLPQLSDAVTHARADARTNGTTAPSTDASRGRVSEALIDDILDPDRSLSDVLAETEKDVIERVLAACDGQVTASADVLGLTRQGLYKKMKRLGIDASQFQPDPEPAGPSS